MCVRTCCWNFAFVPSADNKTTHIHSYSRTHLNCLLHSHIRCGADICLHTHTSAQVFITSPLCTYTKYTSHCMYIYIYTLTHTHTSALCTHTHKRTNMYNNCTVYTHKLQLTIYIPIYMYSYTYTHILNHISSFVTSSARRTLSPKKQAALGRSLSPVRQAADSASPRRDRYALSPFVSLALPHSRVCVYVCVCV